ncbi:glycosyl transferase [Kaistia sp. 32K]|uniref:glycosyltransferase family 2 protein n=1 Tax=Kaistia sp. 32K TaxID=2795690 RepID=UPI001938B75C|nr:glycosyltransferase family 2 protein [Kaistia sp. 32K]BCP55195.1 glycosyl transferase [Kaistia sp. 32K]
MSIRRNPYSIDVIVPCYQEQDALPITAPKIAAYFRDLVASPSNDAMSFRLLLVDDGSKDSTWGIIEGLSEANPEIEGVKLSRNYGHQAAMLSGLSLATADVVVTMDADLQDDIHAVSAMLDAYESGADMALGVRQDRSSDSRGKRGFANAYYRLLRLMGVNIIENHADFRLMSRKALAALLDHGEVNLFLRGLIPTIGFSVMLVPYARQARVAGETKYTIGKMLRLAIDGITSFSVAPLRYVAFVGGGVFLGSILSGIYVLCVRLFSPQTTVPGWASTLLPLLFLGGLHILCIGVVGEYVGKIYLEVKRRPRFIIAERTKSAE